MNSEKIQSLTLNGEKGGCADFLGVDLDNYQLRSGFARILAQCLGQTPGGFEFVQELALETGLCLLRGEARKSGRGEIIGSGNFEKGIPPTPTGVRRPVKTTPKLSAESIKSLLEGVL